VSNVNWCLVAVSFALGLLLTLAFLIRRVKREVPVYGSDGGIAAAKLVGSRGESDTGAEPYGAGSIRLAAGAAAPSGWKIKGNEDSMLYHTVDSPFYEQTIAELWFRDVESAENAGFNRWDSGKSQRGQD
jgi:uncharacterized membrane protein ArfC